MNSFPRKASLLAAAALLIILSACGPEPGRGAAPIDDTYIDFIAEFDARKAELGRRTEFGWGQSGFLHSGFDTEDGGPGARILGKGVLRFDCPWGTTAFELELAMRANPPCPVRVVLNGRALGSPQLIKQPTSHSWIVGDDVLLQRGNLLEIEVPDSSVVRLNRLVLPPKDLSVVQGKRRIPLLPAMPPTRIRYNVRPGPGARLVFETCFRCPPARHPDGVLTYEIEAVGLERKEIVFSRDLKVGARLNTEVMERGEADLASFAGDEVQLTFITRFDGETHWPMAGEVGWGQPRILPARGGDPRAPLIVWLVDTMRSDHLSCYGYHRNTSPNFDALAEGGVRFERVTAQSAWTRPSIATFLTGLYPSAHGAVDREDRLDPNVETMTQLLKTQGYRTAAFSANGNFYIEGWGLIRGFDEVWGYWAAREEQDKTVMSEEMMRDLFTWLERNADERVFLFIHTVDPHDPYAPPPPYDTMFSGDYSGRLRQSVVIRDLRDMAATDQVDLPSDLKYVRGLYDGEIAYNDALFGKFVERLRETGFYDRSLLVVTSDHGEEFSDHGSWGHGHTLFGEQIELPLIMKLPQGRHAGEVVEGRVRQVDLMPSLLDWLGFTPPSTQGLSFKSDVEAGRRPATGEVLAEAFLDGHVLYSLTEDRFQKYILRVSPYPSEELYDLDTDPWEQNNILTASASIAAPMAEKVDAFRRQSEAALASRVDQGPVHLSDEEIANLQALGYLQ